MKEKIKRDNMDKEFYDLQYEAWRSGKNPDMVDPDKYDNLRSAGYYPDEISLGMVYPKKQRNYFDEEENFI
jgi:hypothetical protein